MGQAPGRARQAAPRPEMARRDVWLQLPATLLAAVCGFVAPRDVRSLANTCRTWQRTNALWRHLYARRWALADLRWIEGGSTDENDTDREAGGCRWRTHCRVREALEHNWAQSRLSSASGVVEVGARCLALAPGGLVLVGTAGDVLALYRVSVRREALGLVRRWTAGVGGVLCVAALIGEASTALALAAGATGTLRIFALDTGVPLRTLVCSSSSCSSPLPSLECLRQRDPVGDSDPYEEHQKGPAPKPALLYTDRWRQRVVALVVRAGRAATATWAGDVRVWQLATGALEYDLARTQTCGPLAWDAAGTRLFRALLGGGTICWHVPALPGSLLADGHPVAPRLAVVSQVAAHRAPVALLAFDTTSNLLLATHEGTRVLWGVEWSANVRLPSSVHQLTVAVSDADSWADDWCLREPPGFLVVLRRRELHLRRSPNLNLRLGNGSNPLLIGSSRELVVDMIAGLRHILVLFANDTLLALEIPSRRVP